MVVEKRLVPITKTEYHYIASDGTDFLSRLECEEYERKLGYENMLVIATSVTYRDFWTDNPAIIYHIANQEDWDLLVKEFWHDKQDQKKFLGGNYYIAIINDDNTYTVTTTQDYIKDINECYVAWLTGEKAIIGDLDNLN